MVRVPDFTNEVGFRSLPSIKVERTRNLVYANDREGKRYPENWDSLRRASHMKSPVLKGTFNVRHQHWLSTSYGRGICRIDWQPYNYVVPYVYGLRHRYQGDCSEPDLWQGVSDLASPLGDVSGLITGVTFNMRNEANVRCINSFSSQEVEAGVAIGEAREGLESIVSLLLAAKQLVQAIRRPVQPIRQRPIRVRGRRVIYLRSYRRTRYFKDLADGKTVSDAWLAWNYGLRPIANDIKSLIDALGSIKPELEKVSFTVQVKEELDAGSLAKHPVKATGSATKSCRCTITGARVSEVHLLAKYGLNNPATIGWELMPWSFVADWFVKVGDTLSTITALSGVEFVDGYINEYYTHDVQLRNVVLQAKAEGRLPKGRSRALITKRTKLDSAPPAIPYLRSPLKQPIRNALNATALFIGSLR